MTTYLTKAYLLAAAAHEGQLRKGGLDEPYIVHPVRVALAAVEAGLPPSGVAAALLHDVVEDSAVTLDMLTAAGLPERTVHLVGLLTKPPKPWADTTDAERAAYYARIMSDPEAVALKLLDRTDNLHDMVRTLPRTRRWATNYLAATKVEFAPLVYHNTYAIATAEFRRAIKALEAALATGE